LKKKINPILKTNARLLSYSKFAKSLFDFGLREVSVPLYSHISRHHDSIVKVDGAFNQTIKGIKNWKSLGGNIIIDTDFKSEKNVSDFVDFVLELEKRK
jgi:MoaA/NifB/PqqE/SkfB family radical SAM enzyme